MTFWGRLVSIPLTPVFLAQAAWTIRRLPALPDARKPWSGALAGPDPIRLLVVGDSTAAGVGVAEQEDGLPGNIARELKHRFGRGTEWRVVGESAVDTRGLVARHLGELTEAPADLIFIAVGSSDAIKLRPGKSFARDLRELLECLRDASPDALILVSQLPRFSQLKSFAEPLKSGLARNTAILDAVLIGVISPMKGVRAVATPPVYAPHTLSVDGLHPNATGYRDWIDHAFVGVPDKTLGFFARSSEAESGS